MDGYTSELVCHECPLLFISGLGEKGRHSDIPPYPFIEKGPLVTSDAPILVSPTAERLLDCFLRCDETGVWVGRQPGGPLSPTAFRIRAVGREFRLPPRKARPVSSGDLLSPIEGGNLHSPLSPLSPDSPLFPDGVISHIWLRKHQSVLPAVFISFHELHTETNDNNEQTRSDNEIIAAINESKKYFFHPSSPTGAEETRSSASRSKYVAIIFSDKSILSSTQIEDRLSYIRRGTQLAPNNNFFYMPGNSTPQEIQNFVFNLLAALRPGALDYYRELSKRSRKKRNRGSVPPPTVPTSRALSAQAWSLRYEFKLGIFAEFRQEMDVAVRNYETAYERLHTEVFEVTSSWSERWAEARVLADGLALRIVRCFLWNDQPTAAKRRWSYHIQRMKEIVDRKGRGTDTYGFAGWMSRWNQCLGELVQMANLPVFAVTVPIARGLDPPEHEPVTIFAPPERLLAGSGPVYANEYLHHSGYYYKAAAEWMEVRRIRSRKISADDQDIHDTYLVPPPQEELAFDHGAGEMALYATARREFDTRQQKRMADSIAYRLAILRMQKGPTDNAQWGQALRDLRTVASSYRREGWWSVLEDVLWRVVECGKRGGDLGSAVVAELELMCAGVFRERKGHVYDLGRCLDGVDTEGKPRPTIVVKAGDVVNMLTVSYAFENPKAHVGDSITSQLVVSCHSHPSAAPLVFEELKISYEGSLKTVILHHTPDDEIRQAVHRIDLKGKLHDPIGSDPPMSPTLAKSSVAAEADLSFRPRETKIFEIASVLREAGEAKAACATFAMVSEDFEMDFLVMLQDEEEAGTRPSVHPLPGIKGFTTQNGGNGVWWIPTDDGKFWKKPLRAKEPDSIEILPRPPKIEITSKGLEKGVYIDEEVHMHLEVANGEDEDANVGINVRILGWPEEEAPLITWKTEDGTETPESPSLFSLGDMSSSAKRAPSISFKSAAIPADCVIEVKTRYHLLSDPETPIEKTVVFDMPILNPFHATYDFSPRVHPDTWPDYFVVDEDSGGEEEEQKQIREGITQRWRLEATILGVGEEDLVIEGCELPVLKAGGQADCSVECSTSDWPSTLEPTKSSKIIFFLDILKHSLEDRSPCSIDTILTLTWRRSTSSSATTTTTTTSLAIPRLFVPLREPRVLAVATPCTNPSILKLHYTLENPTNYFLTFNLLMESNEAFAFSGPKQLGLQVLPLSRVEIKYRVFPHVRKAWIRPHLRVVDRYFNKTLKCSPGGESMGVDKAGLMIWVPEEEEKSEAVEKVEELKADVEEA